MVPSKKLTKVTLSNRTEAMMKHNQQHGVLVNKIHVIFHSLRYMFSFCQQKLVVRALKTTTRYASNKGKAALEAHSL
jgi:hypothetical protein